VGYLIGWETDARDPRIHLHSQRQPEESLGEETDAWDLSEEMGRETGAGCGGGRVDK